eukprot:TRINITY_DN11524_c2_g1_i1.p1 TRINITY_DN11524_c2_g1~~TRINITY_DN11524_c2_g1_i1.p1  ORF type:complete len:182 (+),score=12.09 TRINITY_DN11524_c2_g1_i1:198-743(+)
MAHCLGSHPEEPAATIDSAILEIPTIVNLMKRAASPCSVFCVFTFPVVPPALGGGTFFFSALELHAPAGPNRVQKAEDEDAEGTRLILCVLWVALSLQTAQRSPAYLEKRTEFGMQITDRLPICRIRHADSPITPRPPRGQATQRGGPPHRSHFLPGPQQHRQAQGTEPRGHEQGKRGRAL